MRSHSHTPQGWVSLERLAEELADALVIADRAVRPVENPRVLGFARSLVQDLENDLLELAGLAAEQYPAESLQAKSRLASIVGRGAGARQRVGSHASRPNDRLKSCGANAPGGGGFQPGNTCRNASAGGSTHNPAAGTKPASLSANASPARSYPPANPNGRSTLERFKDAQGNWTPERQQLHESIIQRAFVGKTPVESPIGLLMGGGPASGKSTVIKGGGLTLDPNTVTIDSDEAKKGIPEYLDMTAKKDLGAARFVHEESSHIAKQTMKRAAGGQYNLMLDGTGNGSLDQLARKVDVLRSTGHRVVAHYVTVDTETAVERSNQRALKTGRMVPSDFIRANHRAVSQVVPKAIQAGLFDEFTLWDTNEGESRAIARATGRKLEVLDANAWANFLTKGE